jgi:hypothetical protein
MWKGLEESDFGGFLLCFHSSSWWPLSEACVKDVREWLVGFMELFCVSHPLFCYLSYFIRRCTSND